MTGNSIAQSPALAPEVRNYSPFRLYGTNLYDFTEIIQSVLKGIPDPRYCIRGTVISVDFPGVPGSMIIRRAAGAAGFALAPVTNQLSNNEDLIAALAAVSLAKATNGMIPLTQYNVLSPGAQAYFRWVQPTEDVLIANLPREFLKTNKNVQLFALPLGKYRTKAAGTDPEGLLYFDYGLRFSGDPSAFGTVLRVAPSGIHAVRSPKGNVLEGKATANQKLIDWQHQEATNGAAHAQYSLGKRYLKGDGVPVNQELARYWLELSAKQNFPDAIRLLETWGTDSTTSR